MAARGQSLLPIAAKATKNACPCTPLFPAVLATGGMRQRHTKASLTLRTVCADDASTTARCSAPRRGLKGQVLQNDTLGVLCRRIKANHRKSRYVMSSLTPATKIENVAGHIGTESALTLVGALSGMPLAALLPVLAKSLASERQKQRVESAFAQIDATLRQHSAAIQDITDAQYKLINETILALLHTTSAEKIEYLRMAVSNCLSLTEILPQEAIVLSRIVRDISAEEADFLVINFAFERVQTIWPAVQHEDFRVLCVDPSSTDALVVTGLVSLGLLAVAEATYDGPSLLQFSPIVAKLLVLLGAPRAPNQSL